MDWKKQEDFVERESKERGFDGRFGPGTPRISDGSMLFLLHLVKKMRPVVDGGSRIGIVLNGSPLFTGNAESGESEIRRYLLEQDLVEAIVALPVDMFYNTDIATYIWLLHNNKAKFRKGKVQLIDASSQFVKMRKSLGDKRNEITEDNITNIVKSYINFEESPESKLFNNQDFAYTQVTIEQPLKLSIEVTEERLALLSDDKILSRMPPAEREKTLGIFQEYIGKGNLNSRDAFLDNLRKKFVSMGLKFPKGIEKKAVSLFGIRSDEAESCKNAKGDLEPDPDLRATEKVPHNINLGEYLQKEVLPYVPNAWIDHSKNKIGYEIPFTRHFFKYVPPPSLAEIDQELKRVAEDIQTILKGLSS